MFVQKKDYENQIQEKYLEEIITGDYAILTNIEASVKQEISSYLSNRYDITKIILDIEVWDSSKAYAIDTQIVYPTEDGTMYVSNVATLAGDEPSISIKWTLQDNRDNYIIMIFIDMVLYHLLSRVSPRMMNQVREARYNNSVKWLKDASAGRIDTNLPIPDPALDGGSRVLWGSIEKNNNVY